MIYFSLNSVEPSTRPSRPRPQLYDMDGKHHSYMLCCLVVRLTNNLLDINFLSHFLVSHNIFPFHYIQLFSSHTDIFHINRQTIPSLPCFTLIGIIGQHYHQWTSFLQVSPGAQRLGDSVYTYLYH
jgi:hypothetical protein